MHIRELDVLEWGGCFSIGIDRARVIYLSYTAHFHYIRHLIGNSMRT